MKKIIDDLNMLNLDEDDYVVLDAIHTLNNNPHLLKTKTIRNNMIDVINHPGTLNDLRQFPEKYNFIDKFNTTYKIDRADFLVSANLLPLTIYIENPKYDQSYYENLFGGNVELTCQYNSSFGLMTKKSYEFVTNVIKNLID
jgi:hypothetical protein